MEQDPQSARAPDSRIALLIDADNVSHTYIRAMLTELSKYGTANIRRAYGNWGADGLKGWRDKLHESAIRPMQQFSYSAGKNATDIALVIDAMELLYTQKPDAFCIASSDADFTPLVMRLKENGHEVYGFGEHKTPAPFREACTTFVFLEGLVAAAAPAEALAKPPKAAKKSDDKPAAKLPIAQDAKLIEVLRGAVEAAMYDDGWASMSAAGSTAKRQAPIDPRNYGVKNFPALFEATGLFDIYKDEDGRSYVSDKRNKDRAEKPAT